MLLVIPSITIKDGICIGKIDYPNSSFSAPSYEKPEDRARLLRKENAKAVHLIFEDDREWNSETLKIIENVRKAIDIPIEISLSTLPKNISDLKYLIQSGIYRLFLPSQADDFFLTDCINDLTCQKIAISLPLETASEEALSRLKKDGITRICITLPRSETTLPAADLQHIAESAKKIGLRLSLLFGVHSYIELMQLSDLEPGFDSVILGAALDENSFPCQFIWRETELRAYSDGNNEANLWKNPLVSTGI
jgi:phosphoribosylformimino-5-aminoimidazole carboxamide ribonucleotide (ProFAR) isomerase